MSTCELIPVKLGLVTFPSKRARVSDPCYDEDTWCSGMIPLEQEEWTAWAILSDEDDWGTRVAQLVLRSDGSAPAFWERGWGEDQKIDVGVDSGQAGFFDVASFKKDSTVPKEFDGCEEYGNNGEPGDHWYDMCCNVTNDGEVHAGIIPDGVVSSSGFGDGGYRCYKKKEKGGAITIRIVFIGDDSYTEKYVKAIRKEQLKSRRGKKKAKKASK